MKYDPNPANYTMKANKKPPQVVIIAAENGLCPACGHKPVKLDATDAQAVTGMIYSDLVQMLSESQLKQSPRLYLSVATQLLNRIEGKAVDRTAIVNFGGQVEKRELSMTDKDIIAAYLLERKL